jgi:prepilin-type N-terminal cleavage/methylation domain-containing protein
MVNNKFVNRILKMPKKFTPYNYRSAFTLVELSIVLVIIGLVAGGILVGQDLINAATIRAQVSQIEKYQTAVNTFKVKTGYLPGDIPASEITALGFVAAPTRAGTAGRGNGDGKLEGWNGADAYPWNQSGESFFFWEDLSTNSGLIEGGFKTYTDGVVPSCGTIVLCRTFFPAAKIGEMSSVYVHSGSASNMNSIINYFNISIISVGTGAGVGTANSPAILPAPAFTVAQAYAIDEKMDDGKPLTGNVTAEALGGVGGTQEWSTYAGTDSATTCFHTTGGAAYSNSYSGGTSVNCSLAFKFGIQ